jgi:hypothetical protein
LKFTNHEMNWQAYLAKSKTYSLQHMDKQKLASVPCQTIDNE